MVGLPARGKSYISQRLSQYISFFYGTPCKVFNVGDYRRQLAGAFQPASFYDPDNAEAMQVRKEASEKALVDLKAWMEQMNPPRLERGEGQYVSGDFGAVAIFDATNTTRSRRQWLKEELAPTGAKLIFLESVCTDEEILESNITDSKLGVKDYEGKDAESSFADFKARIHAYEKVYETVDEKELSWIKLIDGGRQVAMNNIRGFLASRIAQFLVNMHVQKRPFFFSRHGQSEYNALGKIGGDSELTEHGEEYARALGQWVETNVMKDETGKPQPARLWTSSLCRTVNTARHIPHPTLVNSDGIEWVQMRPKVFHNLDEIYAGKFDGMTYEDIDERYPEEAKARRRNKFEYRYPRGESYGDLIARLEPMAHEMERQRHPVVVVAHQAILRVLIAYFSGMKREDCVKLSIPLNQVIKITPTAKGCEEQRHVILDPRPGSNLDPASH